MKISKQEKFFLLFWLLVAATFSGLLVYELTKTQTGSEKIIGKIVFKNRVAQRKFANSVVWQNVQNTFPIRNKDTVRTQANSEAIITLNDGTEIRMNPDSMIYLNITDAKSRIDFSYGSVSAKSEKPGSKLEIQSGNQTLSMSSGEAKLEKSSESKEDLKVNVIGGKVDLKVGDKTESVGANESLSLSGKTIEKQVSSFRPIAPAEDERFFQEDSSKRTIPVTFAVERSGGSDAANIEIATSSNFKRVNIKQNLSGDSVAIALPAGTYYWRVKSNDAESVPKKFTILENPKPVLRSPEKGRVFLTSSEKTIVDFSWKEQPNTSEYKLEISNSPEFLTVLETKTTSANSFTMNLPVGNYFWRVSAKDYATKREFVSNANEFLVKETEIQAVRLFNPTENTAFPEETEVNFSWSSNRESEFSKIEISETNSFEKLLVSDSTKLNYYTLQKPLTANTYFWRVVSNFGSRGTKISNPNSFRVIERRPINLLSPKDGATIAFNTQKKQIFSWEKFGGNLPTKLILANEKKETIKTLSSQSNFAPFETLEPGKYFWKVERGASLIQSSPWNEFSISEPEKEFKLLSPVPGAKFDLRNIRKIEFSWQTPSPETKSEWELYQLIGRKQILVGKQTLNQEQFEFTNVEKLDSGNFEWRVKVDKALLKNQFSISQEETKKIQIISPSKVYIEE